MPVPAPVAPIRLDGLGIDPTFARDLLLKTIFRMNLSTTMEMATTCAVVAPVIETLIDMCRQEGLIETLGNRGASTAAELRYQLTDGGRTRAQDALTQSEYYGAFPVSLEGFEELSEEL